MGCTHDTVCSSFTKQLSDSSTLQKSGDDARYRENVRTNNHKHSVLELRTPHWRRLEKYSKLIQCKWSRMFAGCIHRRISSLWGKEHVLSSNFDGNTSHTNNRSTKTMECLTSQFLCIVLRFALDSKRVEQALSHFLTKSQGTQHILFDSCDSSYDSSKKLLHAWFTHVIEYLDSFHAYVNIEVHDTWISLTDCFKFQLTSKEDIEVLEKIRKEWRSCFDSSDEKTLSLTHFKSHEESLRVVRRIPLMRCFFNCMQSKRVQKTFRLHMHSQLYYMAQQCKSSTLLFLTERTLYSHIEEPYPFTSIGHIQAEKRYCFFKVEYVSLVLIVFFTGYLQMNGCPDENGFKSCTAFIHQHLLVFVLRNESFALAYCARPQIEHFMKQSQHCSIEPPTAVSFRHHVKRVHHSWF